MQTRPVVLLLLLFILTACQNEAELADVTPQTDMAEVVLPDEHLILATDPTPIPTNTPEITPRPTIAPTPTSPPLFQAANLLQEPITVHIDDDVPAAVALGQLPPPTVTGRAQIR